MDDARTGGQSPLGARLSPVPAQSPHLLDLATLRILRLFGASIGPGVHIYPSVQISLPWNLSVRANANIGDRAIVYNLGHISIGEGATVSQGAHLCAGTHDYRQASLPLIKAPISIGEGAWICADAFVGPGVNVGDYAIVGARAVLMRDIDDSAIVAGNPATEIGKRPLPRAP